MQGLHTFSSIKISVPQPQFKHREVSKNFVFNRRELNLFSVS